MPNNTSRTGTPWFFMRADGKRFCAEPHGDAIEMLNAAERASADTPEFDNAGRPTAEWEDDTGLLHCANCRALTWTLYGDAAECACCFALRPESEDRGA